MSRCLKQHHLCCDCFVGNRDDEDDRAETIMGLDTAAGFVQATAECEAGKRKSVAFDNVPAFVFELDFEVDVPGIGNVKCDIAWGGMIYALVDVAAVGLEVTSANGAKLVEAGEKIKRAVQAACHPVHPENPGIAGVSIVEFTAPLQDDSDGKQAVNAVVVSPGRLDRSPCGTGTCARLALLHKRGLLKEGEIFTHVSPILTEFKSHIRGLTKVGDYDAVLPTVQVGVGSRVSSKSCLIRAIRFHKGLEWVTRGMSPRNLPGRSFSPGL